MLWYTLRGQYEVYDVIIYLIYGKKHFPLGLGFLMIHICKKLHYSLHN